MSSKIQLEWELPEEIDAELRNELWASVQREAAPHLYRAGKISSGYGARLLGISRLEFIDLLREHEVPMISLDEEDLQSEIELSRHLAEKQ